MKAEIELYEDRDAEFAEQGRALATEAATFAIIADDGHRDRALAFAAAIKERRRIIADLLGEPIAKAHALHKSLTSRRKALDGPHEEAERIVKSSIGAYEAEKRAAIERQREAERQAAMEAARIAEQARQAEIAAAKKAAEDVRLAQATALEAEGKQSQAEAVLAVPVVVAEPPPVNIAAPVTPKYEKPDSTSTRTTWKYEITDEALIPREYLTPDAAKIGAAVRAQKGSTAIPGVRAYPEHTAVMK